MKKSINIVLLIIIMSTIVFLFCGCQQADRVNYNISKEADNFNVYRRVTVINCIKGDVLFSVEGRMSINADQFDDQLEIVVELADGKYKKHFIGLSDNVTYTVEDITGSEVSKYHYEINFNPKMWLPFVPVIID